MKNYDVVRHNAQKFADAKNQPVYICVAKRKLDYCIIFSKDQCTKNYDIIEIVNPNITLY